MQQIIGEIISRETHVGGQELRIQAPALARELKPGQPVLVHGAWGADPLLRRMFYPIQIEAESWVLRLPPSGDRAHAWLRAAPIGTQIDCLGPIGAGFHRPADRRRVLCLGQEGESWTVLPAATLCAEDGAQVALVLIGASRRDLVPPARVPPLVEVHLQVPDGDANTLGRLARQLSEMITWADLVLAAGDLAFYAELASIIREARFGLQRGFAQLLHPVRLMCGYGACQACAVDLVAGSRQVCVSGPVFDLVDVVS